ncbi:MAG: hypothetical protein IJP66_06985, partial [Kiritimatiellae bacterium]|nr:hypothetical protein [Kiritimatiellia bacterium]
MDRPFYDDEPERRWTPLVLAALASLAIHALLYFRVSEMRFDVTARIPESLRETPARRFVNFERLSGDPQQRRSGEVADAGAAGEALGDAAAGSAPLPAAEMEALFEAPAVSFTAPPPQPSSANAAQFKNTPLHEIAHDAPVWQPRQEVVAIAKRLARDDAALMPRR